MKKRFTVKKQDRQYILVDKLFNAVRGRFSSKQSAKWATRPIS